MHRLIIPTLISLLTSTSFAGEPAKETKTTKSGMQYTSLVEGTGATPGATDTVSVNYRGTLLNGRNSTVHIKAVGRLNFDLTTASSAGLRACR